MEERLLFRCSGIGALMTNKQGVGITPKQLERINELSHELQTGTNLKGNKVSWTPTKDLELNELIKKRDAPFELSDTAKNFVKELWLLREKGFRKQINSKYLEKGKYTEEDAISLLTYVDSIFYKKNKERKDNGVLTGECDIYYVFNTKEELPEWRQKTVTENTKFPLKVIQDTKSCWDAETFMNSGLDNMYEGQGQGYMELWDADEFWLRYTLNDCPAHIYEFELYKFKLTNNIIDEDTPDNIEKVGEFQRSLQYSMNPMYTKEERVKTFVVQRDESYMEELYTRISYAIDYYKTLSLNNI